MIPYLSCDAAREMLQPFVDGELPMTDQVALEAHLRWCNTCRARVEDLRLIGASLRLGAPAPVADEQVAEALAAVQAGVLARVRAEREQSFPVWFGRLFEDMHFMLPAFGATAALAACVLAVLGINAFARSVDPDSMADRIQMLANPGSDRNPMQLDAWMLAPALLTETPVLEAMPADDSTVALAAVVTREGLVADYAVLTEGANSSATAADVRDAVRRTRFAPAQTGAGPVAVNLVWVLERTTVKAPLHGSGQSESIAPLEPIPDVIVRPVIEPPAEPELHPARS